MSEQKAIQLLFFGGARECVGRSALRWEIGEIEITLEALREELFNRVPSLRAARESLRFAINGSYADLNAEVRSGDEVAVIPPVAGG
jgi:molybdopterin converting factor subunit 1